MIFYYLILLWIITVGIVLAIQESRQLKKAEQEYKRIHRQYILVMEEYYFLLSEEGQQAAQAVESLCNILGIDLIREEEEDEEDLF